jgi:hypothetical protein
MNIRGISNNFVNSQFTFLSNLFQIIIVIEIAFSIKLITMRFLIICRLVQNMRCTYALNIAKICTFK